MLKLLLAASVLVIVVDSACNIKNSYDDANAKLIVDAHNTMRSKIAKGTYKVLKNTKKIPAATNMRKMAWNCDLQKSAQAWADKRTDCKLVHSNTGGENLFGSSGTGGPHTVNGTGFSASKSWENELNDHGWSTDLKYARNIGHATQMAWWNSDKIGCGYRLCNGGKWQSIIVVCQYRESGNYLGRSAYATGKTCSNCGNGFKCEKATGLCIPA